jgi:hypothetical protein
MESDWVERRLLDAQPAGQAGSQGAPASGGRAHDTFPSAAMTVSLGDFGFCFLEIREGRLILGFGRALNLAAHHFRELGAP